MTSAPSGLLDTSVAIASESGRGLDLDRMPEQLYVSVITIAELQAGVLVAKDTATRARRLATLDSLALLEPLHVDVSAAAEWAYLRARLAEEKRRVNVNDVWIAAIAAANDLPVVTQDGDYEVLHEVGGPAVILV